MKIFQRRLEHYVVEGPTINDVSGFIFLNNAKGLYQRRVLNGIFHKIVVKFNETHTDITFLILVLMYSDILFVRES